MPPRPGRTPSALSAVIPDSTGPECHPLGSWGRSKSPSQGCGSQTVLGLHPLVRVPCQGVCTLSPSTGLQTQGHLLPEQVAAFV